MFKMTKTCLIKLMNENLQTMDTIYTLQQKVSSVSEKAQNSSQRHGLLVSAPQITWLITVDGLLTYSQARSSPSLTGKNTVAARSISTCEKLFHSRYLATAPPTLSKSASVQLNEVSD